MLVIRSFGAFSPHCCFEMETPGRGGGKQAGRYCCLEGWSRTAGRSVGIGVAAVVDSWQEGKKIRTHPSTTSRTVGAG